MVYGRELLGRLRSCFVRTQTWQHAEKYVSALVSEIPKRNGWTIAEHAGDRTPDRTQRLLNRAAWDTFAAMSQIRRFAAAGLDEVAYRKRRRGSRVAALDEAGQAKAGTATCGVKRQYMGCAGRVATESTRCTCRMRAGADRTRADRRPPVDPGTNTSPTRDVYGHGTAAGFEFRTKGQLAIDICADAYADGLVFDFACGDEVHGNCTQLREFFEQREQAYVLRVASTFIVVGLAAGTRSTCAQAVTLLAKDKRRWEVRSAGAGSKGQRWYAWMWIATASPRHHLLVRRHLRSGELAFHYCYVPEGQPLTKTRLIRAAGLRWPIVMRSVKVSGRSLSHGGSPPVTLCCLTGWRDVRPPARVAGLRMRRADRVVVSAGPGAW